MVQIIEGVAFNQHDYYNALHYMTISGKLKACQGGLKWHTLTKNRPIKILNFKTPSKSKRMVEKSFFGVLLFVPPVDDLHQIAIASETTNVTHVKVFAMARYNEWNPQFEMSRV